MDKPTECPACGSKLAFHSGQSDYFECGKRWSERRGWRSECDKAEEVAICLRAAAQPPQGNIPAAPGDVGALVEAILLEIHEIAGGEFLNRSTLIREKVRAALAALKATP